MRIDVFRRLDQMSDHDFVEQTRRSIAKYDRLRPWLLAFWIAILAIAACVWIMGVWVIRNVNIPNGMIGFFVGATLGSSVGYMLVHILHIIFNLLPGLRAERLLVKYYDALVSVDKIKSGEQQIASGASISNEEAGWRLERAPRVDA